MGGPVRWPPFRCPSPMIPAVPPELLAARSQMAFTLGFHIVLACLGVGLPTMVLIANAIGIDLNELPVTPDRVMEAMIQRRRQVKLAKMKAAS